MQLTVPFELEYSNDITSVDEVIRSLQAQSEFISAGLAILNEAYSDLALDNTVISIQRIETHSKKFEFVLLMLASYQTDVQDFIVGQYEGVLDMNIPEFWEPAVSIATLAGIYFVARFAYDKVTDPTESPQGQPLINNSFNTTVNLLGEHLGKSESDIHTIIADALPKTKRLALARQAANLFRPARNQGDASIRVGKDRRIEQKEIKEFPTDTELKKLGEPSSITEVEAEVEIRATDRDKGGSGWAGVILNNPKYPKRLPMDLYPNIDPSDLAEHSTVLADIVVDVDVSSDGSMKPKKIHMIEFRGVVDDNA